MSQAYEAAAPQFEKAGADTGSLELLIETMSALLLLSPLLENP